MIQALFLDLETTGLNPRFHSILEVYAAIVDENLKVVDSFHAVVFCPPDRLYGEMNEYVRRMHTPTGLLDEVEASPRDERQVDEALANFVSKYGDKVQLAGNSIHFDLAFIKDRMPRTAGLLSHHVFDVSGTARLLREFCGIDVPYPKGDIAHRAEPDVRHSLEQVRLIREVLRAKSSKEAA